MTDDIKSKKTSVERRKAVRNILAGSGLTIGAATSGVWTKPVLNSVITPAHAQTSAVVMLFGNAGLVPVVMSPKENQNANSVLDFFIGPANAGQALTGPNLAGGCLSMTINGSAFTLDISFFSAPSIQLMGSIDGSKFSASGAGVTVTGSVDLAAAVPAASGRVSNDSGSFAFSLNSSASGCTPIEPTTTTATPTSTTGSPTTTTGSPTTTTGSPTTTTGSPTTTTGSPTTTTTTTTTTTGAPTVPPMP